MGRRHTRPRLYANHSGMHNGTNRTTPTVLHRVLDLRGVTEFTVIEEYHLLLVLADKVRVSGDNIILLFRRFTHRPSIVTVWTP